MTTLSSQFSAALISASLLAVLLHFTVIFFIFFIDILSSYITLEKVTLKKKKVLLFNGGWQIASKVHYHHPLGVIACCILQGAHKQRRIYIF